MSGLQAAMGQPAAGGEMEDRVLKGIGMEDQALKGIGQVFSLWTALWTLGG